MDKKVIFAIVAAVVIVVAAVGVYALLNNDSKSNDVTFLIQDDKGVHFWLKGNGETSADALENAFSSYEDGTLIRSSYGINTLFGMGSELDEETDQWSYWVQFTWIDNEWSYNNVGMNSINSADVEYMLVLYGKGIMNDTPLPAGLPIPSSAKLWDGNTDGVVFTIESSTGLYFHVNGKGTTVYDAIKDADSKYNLGFSGMAASLAENITMFNLSKSGGYAWEMYTVDDAGTGWDESSLPLGGLASAENSQICFKYNNGSLDIFAPVYAA